MSYGYGGYDVSGSDLNMSSLSAVHSSTSGYRGERRRHRSSKPRSHERREISEDYACELAASKLFRRLDRYGNGQLEESQVLPLLPELERHMEGTNAAGMAGSLRQRSVPIGRDEWMSLMSAIRAIVGPRLFRSSIRAALEHLEHQPRSPSPKPQSGNVRCFPAKAQAQAFDAFLPGAVEPSQEPPPGPPRRQPANDNEDESYCGPGKSAPPQAERSFSKEIEEKAEKVMQSMASMDRQTTQGPVLSLDEWAAQHDPDYEVDETDQMSYYAGRLQQGAAKPTINLPGKSYREPAKLANLSDGENVLFHERDDTPKVAVFLPGQYTGERTRSSLSFGNLDAEVAEDAEAERIADEEGKQAGTKAEQLVEGYLPAGAGSEGSKGSAQAVDSTPQAEQDPVATAALLAKEAELREEALRAKADASQADLDRLMANAAAMDKDVWQLEAQLAQARAEGKPTAALARQLEEAREAAGAARAAANWRAEAWEQEKLDADAELLRAKADASKADLAQLEARAAAMDEEIDELEKQIAQAKAEGKPTAALVEKLEEIREAAASAKQAVQWRSKLLEEELLAADAAEKAAALGPAPERKGSSNSATAGAGQDCEAALLAKEAQAREERLVAKADASQADLDRLVASAAAMDENVQQLEQQLAQAKADGKPTAALEMQLEEAREAAAAARAAADWRADAWETEKLEADAELLRAKAEATRTDLVRLQAGAAAMDEEVAELEKLIAQAEAEGKPTAALVEKLAERREAAASAHLAVHWRSKILEQEEAAAVAAEAAVEAKTGSSPGASPQHRWSPGASPSSQKDGTPNAAEAAGIDQDAPPLPGGRKKGAPPSPEESQKEAPPLPGGRKEAEEMEGGKEAPPLPDRKESKEAEDMEGGKEAPPLPDRKKSKEAEEMEGGKEAPPLPDRKESKEAREMAEWKKNRPPVSSCGTKEKAQVEADLAVADELEAKAKALAEAAEAPGASEEVRAASKQAAQEAAEAKAKVKVAQLMLVEAELQAEAEACSKEAQLAEAEQEQAEQELAKAEQELAQADAEVAEAVAEVEETKKAAEAAAVELEQLGAAVDAKDEEVRQLLLQAEKAEGPLKAELMAKVEAAQKEAEALKAKHSAKKAQVAELTAKADKAEEKVKAAKAKKEQKSAEVKERAATVAEKVKETERKTAKAKEVRMRAQAVQVEREGIERKEAERKAAEGSPEGAPGPPGPPGLPKRGRDSEEDGAPEGGKASRPEEEDMNEPFMKEIDGVFPSRASAADIGDLASVPEGGAPKDRSRVRDRDVSDMMKKPETPMDKPETPLDSKGRKPADVAEEEAFMRSYNEIRQNRAAKKKTDDESSATDAKLKKVRQGGDSASNPQVKIQEEKAAQQQQQQEQESGDSSSIMTQLMQEQTASANVMSELASSSSGRMPKKESRDASGYPPGQASRSKSPSGSRGSWLADRMETQEESSSSAGGVKLPPLVHSQSAGDLQEVNPDALIQRLQQELSAERVERERMSNRVQDLERKLKRSASQPTTNKDAGKEQFFGVKKVSCYKQAPVPPPPPSSPKRTKAFMLPALRTIPYSPDTKRVQEEQATRAAADLNMERARDKELSRAERSKARIEAVGQLEKKGMSSWKERKAEKVARLNDLTVFRESMWGSFFEWHEDYSLV